MRSLKALIAGVRGQDLAEYCLLTALVALIGAGMLIHLSGGMQAVWAGANNSLVYGTPAASGSSSGSAATISRPAR